MRKRLFLFALWCVYICDEINTEKPNRFYHLLTTAYLLYAHKSENGMHKPKNQREIKGDAALFALLAA